MSSCHRKSVRYFLRYDISPKTEEIKTADVLLKSGAGIFRINAIRRHIFRLNRGMLAKRIQAKDEKLLGIAINDAADYPPTKDISVLDPNYHSTPIGLDSTTFEEARRVIHDYSLAERLPQNVVKYLINPYLLKSLGKRMIGI